MSHERCIQLREGTKKPAQRWRDDGLAHLPGEVGRDYAIKCGKGLIVLDVDYPEKLLRELPETLVVKSPHGDDDRGHRYYKIGSRIANSKEDWGDLQAEGKYVVGPGSILDHDGYCSDDCQLSGESAYEIVHDRQIATLDPEILSPLISNASDDSTGRKSNPTTPKDPPPELPDEPNPDDVAVVRTAIREFQRDNDTTQRALDYTISLANGKYGKFGKANDHSSAEVALASKLYGILLFTEDDENASQRIYSYISHACKNNRFTETGNIRKWVHRDDRYRWNVIESATKTFVPELWDRWRQKREGGYNWTGEYGTIIRRYVLKAVHTAYDERPGYPTKREVVAVAQGLNPERSERSHETVLQRLRTEYEQVKMAWLGGNNYVYYPKSEPDPPNAEWVRCGGEKSVSDPTR